MIRPLAITGFTLLTGLFIFNYLPPVAFMPLAVVLVVLVVLFCKIKCKFHWNVALISATLLFAMLWLAIYSYFFTLPQKEFVGKTSDATVVVMETGKSYMPELVSAKLKVAKVNGEEIKPFFVWCNGFDYYEIGDIVNAKLLFEKIDNPVSLRNSNIDKIVMQVKQEGETVQMGTQGGFEMFFKKLQVKASSILQLNVSGENGKICTAIVTGDKSELSKDVKMQFRQAGLSHILVVSGLHLGIIAGFATLLLGKIFKNKKFSTFLSILFVLAFICFTGFTPSTVRAGVVICFVLIGKACHFETDAVTSMALALILLLLSNPYACLDAGLLLSFSSTLGLVFLSYFQHEYIEQLKTNKWFCFAKPFLVPLFVMVATLPVMIYINGNVSIVGILANIIVVPLLTPVLIMGVITLITAVLTGMSDIAFMFGFFEKVFIDIIRFFVNLANKVPYGTISVGGIYVFCVCACIYGLAFFLYKNKKYKAMAVSSVSLFVFSIMFSFFVNYNCIKIAPVGNGKNPSVVISKNQKAFVIYKGSVSNIYAIDEYLQNNNLYSVDGIYDISQNENGDILSQGIKETKIYTVNNLFDTKTIFDDIIVTVKQQKHSALCIIDVAGYKLALNSGQVDFDEISPINVYIAGTSKPKNIICDTAIFTDGKSMYYDELNCKDKRLWQRGSYIWIRPEKAVKIVDK